MLDENLPAFFLRPSPDGLAHHRAFYLTHRGSEPEACYTLQHADPAVQASKNCYAAALFDAYNPDVLYGEVLARPTWTQPTLSAEAIRLNGGIAPPPQPILPTEFVIQLYNPDQQVAVKQIEGKWGASAYYEFSMPQTTFRAPSASTLDRTQSDPASLASTPKVNFVWRKEKLSKDLTCFMTGKSTDAITKKKSQRDPDIAIALFRSLREMTIYEPNLYRVEMEDPKGLECVLLLAAVVIKDFYLGSGKDDLKTLFNISDTPAIPHKLSAGGRKLSSPLQPGVAGFSAPVTSFPRPIAPLSRSSQQSHSIPPSNPPRPIQSTRPPPADPRTQWELEAETARLKAAAEAEERTRRRQRAERLKAEEAESRRLRKMVEQEKREAQRKRDEVERETERLRRLYGVQALPERRGGGTAAAAPSPAARPGQPPARPFSNSSSRLQTIPQRAPLLAGPPQQQRPLRGSNGLYMQPSASHSSVNPGGLYMSGANNASSLSVAQQRPGGAMKKKTSFWGIRNRSDDHAGAGGGSAGAGSGSGSGSGAAAVLRKKGSAVW